MRIRLNVTKEDIANGIPEDALHCPIAQCLKRRFTNVIVRDESFLVISGTNYIAGSLTASARKFVKRFDAGKKVRAFRTVLTAATTY